MKPGNKLVLTGPEIQFQFISMENRINGFGTSSAPMKGNNIRLGFKLTLKSLTLFSI